jgi:hypothetical protein
MSETTPSIEQPNSSESEVKKHINPAVSRILMGVGNVSLIEPKNQPVLKEHKDKMVEASGDDLPYDAANAVSLESREQAPQMTNDEWNQDFWRNVQIMTHEDLDEPLRTERINAFDALGIKVDKEEMDVTGSFNVQAEAFRKTYVDIGKSDIKQFARDISNDCKNDDGTVDMDKLEVRLQAIEPLLAVFGTEKDANLLVKDFVVADAIMTQSEAVKRQAADSAAFSIKDRAIYGSEQVRIQALWEKTNQPGSTAPETDSIKDEAPPKTDTSKERIPDEPLTPELARTDPEKFKDLIIQNIKDRHPEIEATDPTRVEDAEPDQPETSEPTPIKQEAVQLTRGGDVIKEIQEGLISSDKESVEFEASPDTLLPFIMAKMSENNLTISQPIAADITDKSDGSGRQMHLNGAVSKGPINVALDIMLENAAQGLKVVDNNTATTGFGAFAVRGRIEEAIENLDQNMKEQITKAIGGVGKVESIQIGDGILKVKIKK